jgi:hypothetical protein
VPRNSVFPEDGVLLRAGDRMRYFAVDALEYDEIWTAVEAGEYEYDVVEETFDVQAYLGEREPTSLEEVVRPSEGRPEVMGRPPRARRS